MTNDTNTAVFAAACRIPTELSQTAAAPNDAVYFRIGDQVTFVSKIDVGKGWANAMRSIVSRESCHDFLILAPNQPELSSPRARRCLRDPERRYYNGQRGVGYLGKGSARRFERSSVGTQQLHAGVRRADCRGRSPRRCLGR